MFDEDVELHPVYLAMYRDLVEWITSNPKTCNHVTQHNARHMFLFDNKQALLLDLNRFERDYSLAVFPYHIGDKRYVAFIKKVCLVVRDTLIRIKQHDITLNITLKINYATYKKTVYIHPEFK